MDGMRLQKYLAHCGAASRRKAEELIRQGRVSVNGCIIADMGVLVYDTDLVEVDGRTAILEDRQVYIMLNKPLGYVTTSKDQFSRATVLDLVQDVKERVYPVGRLDYDTSGLLILTNDGDFTYRMTHPKHEVRKVYQARIEGMPTNEEIEEFENGLFIDDYQTSPAKISIIDRGKRDALVEVIIHEGKNRQVKKMCEAIGHPVKELKRIAIGNLSLGNLKEGTWRYLKKEEINRLKGELL